MRHRRYTAAWGFLALMVGASEVAAQDPQAGVGLFGTYVTLRLVTVLVLFATPMETFVSAIVEAVPKADSGG